MRRFFLWNYFLNEDFISANFFGSNFATDGSTCFETGFLSESKVKLEPQPQRPLTAHAV